jgi:hypothetical protein
MFGENRHALNNASTGDMEFRLWAVSAPTRVASGRPECVPKPLFRFQRGIRFTARSGNSNEPRKTGRAVICRQRSFKGKGRMVRSE